MASDQAVVLVTVLTAAGTGAVIDLRTRHVPNTVTLPTAMLGVALAGAGASGVSLASSLLGLALGFGLMLPGHLFGATGAGDVKLFAATGAVIGAGLVFSAFCHTALAGGVAAVAYAAGRQRLALTLARTLRLVTGPAETKRLVEAPAANNRFPYAPAIAVGVVLAVLLHGG